MENTMNELIDAIRAAVVDGATSDQKMIGVQACRTIMTALDAEPGKPIALPGAPKPHPLNGLTFDQALDLVIARLSTVANARESAAPQLSPATPRGPQFPIIQPPSLPHRDARPGRRKP
jgi:hypothetical protein